MSKFWFGPWINFYCICKALTSYYRNKMEIQHNGLSVWWRWISCLGTHDLAYEWLLYGQFPQMYKSCLGTPVQPTNSYYAVIFPKWTCCPSTPVQTVNKYYRVKFLKLILVARAPLVQIINSYYMVNFPNFVCCSRTPGATYKKMWSIFYQLTGYPRCNLKIDII